jgi:hypothetical protein
MKQVYSYSRLSAYASCPYKWFKSYVEKYSEPKRTYFEVGTSCHRVAELAAEYCVRQTFINKANTYYRKSKELKAANADCLDIDEFLGYVYDNKKCLKEMSYRNFGNLVYTIDSKISTDEYDIVSMPEPKVYWSFFDQAIAEEKMINPETIEEARHIMRGFYYWYDFSLFPNEVMLAEKKLCFDRSWNKVGFFDENAYYRGVIDNTIYSGDKHIIITDYKTSRAMLTESQVAEDPQLKSYVKMMIHTLGRDNIDSVTVRIVYMRYKVIVSHTFEYIDDVVSSSEVWIDTLAKEIESNGDNIENYKPTRNEHCNRCHIREDGICPIFVKSEKAFITDSMTEATCKLAWKESEVLKDKYQMYQKVCKEFINDTDAVVMIDEKAMLDKHITKVRKFVPEEVVKLGLAKGLNLMTMLPYFGISDTEFKKMLKKNNITINEEEKSKLFNLKNKSTFAALTREEMEE